MLLTRLRPEEACGLKWCAIKETTNELSINNAYKDSPIYNEEFKVIGHTRGDGRLKTPESYRTIPLNDRLKRRLLEHKEKQQKLFKTYKKKWNEKDMDQLVLMKLMGHSDFNTTQKYYISISNKRKKLAVEKAYQGILEKENAV